MVRTTVPPGFAPLGASGFFADGSGGLAALLDRDRHGFHVFHLVQLAGFHLVQVLRLLGHLQRRDAAFGPSKVTVRFSLSTLVTVTIASVSSTATAASFTCWA